MRPDASKNSQISPSTIVRAARAAGSHPHLASVLLQGRKKREYSRQFGSHPGNPGLDGCPALAPLALVGRGRAKLGSTGLPHRLPRLPPPPALLSFPTL